MRIDKFLKISRLIKRRTVAKEVTDNERILVNNKIVKPSYNIKIGDKISIIYGNSTLNVIVKNIDAKVNKETSQTLYDVISYEKKD